MNTPKDRTGNRLLGIASTLLILLALAQGYVSFAAQYGFVLDVKQDPLSSVLEALGLDIGAVIFALLAIASARLGRRALAERGLNVACAAGALAMNAMSANSSSPKELAVYVMPSLLYIAASDRLIAVVRQRVLSPANNAPEVVQEAPESIPAPPVILEPTTETPVAVEAAATTPGPVENTAPDVPEDEVTAEDEPAGSAFEEDDELSGLTDEDAVRKALSEIGIDSSTDDVRGWLALRGRLVHGDTVTAVQDDERVFVESAAEFIAQQDRAHERVARQHAEKVSNPFV